MVTVGLLTSLRRLVRGWAARAGVVVAALLMAGCASVRFDAPRVPSQSFDQPLSTPLGQSYWGQLPAGQSGFHLLVAGPEALAARGALAEAAQRTLDMQYYIVDHGSTASLLLDAALRAAQRGVRVRLLVDGLNVGDRDTDLAMLAAHPGIEVRVFNPFSTRGSFGVSQALEWLGDTDRLNRRMHNKAWIADGAVAVVGGRNVADAYFNAVPDNDFADLDVLAAGPVVEDLSRSFDQFWNSEWAVPIAAIVGPPPSRAELEQAWAEMAARAMQFRQGDYIAALRKTAFGGLVRSARVPLVAAPAQVLFDRPVDSQASGAERTSAIFPVLRQAVEGARHEVLMVSPYLVPGPQGLPVLCGLTHRGVRVKILTNSLASTDAPLVHAGYARYRARMLACGIALYELRPGESDAKRLHIGLSSGARLHAKVVVVDGETVFLGSMNLDPRSRHLNTEVALHIDSRELGNQLTGLFADATALDQAFRVEFDEPGNAAGPLHWDSSDNGQPVRYSREPLASEWRRWLVRLLGALAPEDSL